MTEGRALEANGSGVQARLLLRYRGFALDCALELPAQGISVLFGPSGCGKTTVLRALAGLEPSTGFVQVKGQIWQDSEQGVFVPAHRRRLGFVFQDARLFAHLDVRGNLAFAQRRSQDRAPQRADELIELLGLAHLLGRYPAALSGGERQRVALARALLTRPELLLMDEPLSALDAGRKAEVLPYLERLRETLGVPLVYVTHSASEVARLADHLVLMQAGRVLGGGPARDMLTRLDLPLVHGEDAAALVHAVVAADDAGDGLSRLDVGGLPLWVARSDVAPGQRVRARVLARDVSVTLSRAEDTSVLNVLPAVLEALGDENAEGVTLRLRLKVPQGEAPVLLARITRRSREALGLAPGQSVFAQIKGVALTQ